MDKGILLLITLLISHKTVINAAPMSFRDSITSMSTISKSYSYLESSYAISPKDAFGINISENKGDTYKLKAGEFFYLRRLMRINKINSQTNLWLFSSAGIVNVKKNIKDENYFYLSPTLQFDYETKRVFSLISQQILRVGNQNYDTTKIEGGVSFYETTYNETQPWILLKTRKTKTVDSKIEYIPTLRFINKSLFGEVGVNMDGDPSFHLMYTF
ncbi:hypothetical protein N9S07_00920 [Nitrosomonadales bacterium]|jgi:hypothetical protein|nr:hypothetical protein [Nitrosomonadales bacterium]